MNEEERMDALELQLKDARLMASDADKKYDEVYIVHTHFFPLETVDTTPNITFLRPKKLRWKFKIDFL